MRRNKYVKNAAAVIGKVGLLRYSRYICRGREEEWTGFVSGNTEMKGNISIFDAFENPQKSDSAITEENFCLETIVN